MPPDASHTLAREITAKPDLTATRRYQELLAASKPCLGTMPAKRSRAERAATEMIASSVKFAGENKN
ncbi:MAG: hypothetical protein WAQ52_20155 [Terriglobales bacterium]